MIKIGCRYEETRSMLTEKLNDPFNLEVSSKKMIADWHACYFCGDKILSGYNCFEIIYLNRNSAREIDKDRFFVDGKCMTIIKEKK